MVVKTAPEINESPSKDVFREEFAHCLEDRSLVTFVTMIGAFDNTELLLLSGHVLIVPAPQLIAVLGAPV